MYPIINCHCHVYPDKIAVKAAQSTGDFYDLPMTYDGTVATCKREGAKVGVVHSIIFSVATTPKQVRSINEFIARTADAEPDIFTGLGTMHPDSDDLEGDIIHLKSLGLKAVKLHADIQRFNLDDPKCLGIYELCIKYGLPVLLHAGDSRFDMSNPNRLKPILQKYPQLTVIAAHLGGWSVWEDAVRELVGFENLYVDTCSSFAFLTAERAKKIIRAFGADKVLWGTDYPMWDFAKEVEMFEALGLDGEEKAKIYHKNAQKLFNVKLKCV